MAPAATRLLPPPASRLFRTYSAKPGFVGWLSNTDHKAIGMRFIVTALAFMFLGGVEAALVRLQLVQPQMDLMGPGFYNQLFTMHGTTMMFFFAVPVMEGIAMYMLPLMLGTRQTAFPRMAAFGYYSYLFAGAALYLGFFLGLGPDAGWFSFPTLTLKQFSPSVGLDFWALSISLLELSALSMAVVLIVTIMKHRAPGMTIARMPLFAWAMLIFAWMIVFAMPTLLLATILLELDRTAGTHFFNPPEGGDPLLWQHLFWWFGHPEVYIMFIPALGIIASVLPPMTRRELFGYPFFVLSLIATGFLSFSVWAHHMFATGLPRFSLGFFSAATLMVAVPSAVQIFIWLATVWSSARLLMSTAFLYSVGFVIIFVFGGLSGVTLAVVPFDRQVHDTFYVVAHFHYVLVGGVVFPLLAGIFYWFPKVTGRLMSERLGRWSFWLTFAGVNATFLPMHLSGFFGMARRVYTYHGGLGLTLPNLISTVGALLTAVGLVLVLSNILRSMRGGVPAGADPWGANTLEWATTSPPPPYNFEHIPSVHSRNPLWAQREIRARAAALDAGTPWETGSGYEPAFELGDAPPPTVVPVASASAQRPWAVDVADPGWCEGAADEPRIELELREDRREVPLTRTIDATVDGRNIVSGDSIWPFITAAGASLGIMGVVVTGWSLVIGAVICLIGIGTWHWPERKGDFDAPTGGVRSPEEIAQAAGAAGSDAAYPVQQYPAQPLDTCHIGSQAPLWWGMILFITIEAVFFAAIIGADFYLSAREFEWPPGKTSPPDLGIPIAYTLVLLASSLGMLYGDRGIQEGDARKLVIGQVTALSLAVVFLLLKGYEYMFEITYTWYTHAYGSLSWSISTFHALHVLSVVIKNAFVLALGAKGYFNEHRRLGVQINGIYWHFVVLIWLPLFFTLYVYPWMVRG